MPQHHGARFDQAAQVEALKSAIAQTRVGALDAGRPVLVDQLGRIGAHALAPPAQRLSVAGQPGMAIMLLVLACDHRREHVGGPRFKQLDMPLLAKAPLASFCWGTRAQRFRCRACMGSFWLMALTSGGARQLSVPA